MFDLQIHTIATPHHAFWEPQALVAEAKRIGLTTIAVTDHNTLGSVRELLTAGAQHAIRVVPGVELDSGFNGKLWHTLVYGIEPEASELQALCGAVFERNREDAHLLARELVRRGFQLQTLAKLNRPANVADVGAALAGENVLAERVPGENDEAAGMRYILSELPGMYRPLRVDEIVDVAHRLGGVVVLAHPGRSKGMYAIPATAGDIEAMAAAGIDGIEVYYPAHSAEQQAFYRDLARTHGLLITGGSDSHGPHQPLATWPDEVARDFLAAMQ